MSPDEKKRRAEREAKHDPMAAVAVENTMRREGDGIHGFLARLVGLKVFIEGIRINYRGTLSQVIVGGAGAVEAVVLFPCQRVSWFQKSGPERSYTFTHDKPRLIPWDTIHDIGEEGFRDGKWADV